MAEDEALATVRRALAFSIGNVDTAPLYGHGLAEQRAGAALRDVSRDSYTQRIACDASLVALVEDALGHPLGVGRRTRVVPRRLRRALTRRARGCRFPGCTTTRHVDAHHIRHWAHGGPTDLDNLVHR